MVVKENNDKMNLQKYKLEAIPLYKNKTMKECCNKIKTFEYVLNLNNVPIDMYNHVRNQAINKIYYEIRKEFSDSSFVIVLSENKVFDIIVI